jgi:hypothetical protein
MNNALLDKYRLSAFFAANPTVTAKEVEKLELVKTNGHHFFWNCVHLRDSKGEHPYYSLKSRLFKEDYGALRTRYTEEQQAEIIRGFQAGETIHQIAKRLSFLHQPLSVFSIVYRMAFPTIVPFAKGSWVPYSRQQYESMAAELRDAYQEFGEFPMDGKPPELVEAVREMFAIGWEKPEPQSDHLHEILRRLDKIEQALSPTTPALPSVESVFALDIAIPHNIDRWLSKEALALFCKLVRGGYLHNRDEDLALLELEEFGLVEIPRHAGRDVMAGVTLLIDRLKVTDKGWSLHRLIRDICEQAVYCCLADLGSFMGFNLAVKENDENNSII